MKGVLVRCGIDSSCGHYNAPMNPETGDYVYVPIPENDERDFRPGLETGYDEVRCALRKFSERNGVDVALPEHLRRSHLDPDFDRLTYGDQGRRGAVLRELEPGDLLAFYASFRPVTPWPDRLVYALIGVYRVSRVVHPRDVPTSEYAANAHLRRAQWSDTDVIVWAEPGRSGRLKRAIPIGCYRANAYRVRPDLLRAWGGLHTGDGYIQRSGTLARMQDPERFLEWFNDNELVASNWRVE